MHIPIPVWLCLQILRNNIMKDYVPPEHHGYITRVSYRHLALQNPGTATAAGPRPPRARGGAPRSPHWTDSRVSHAVSTLLHLQTGLAKDKPPCLLLYNACLNHSTVAASASSGSWRVTVYMLNCLPEEPRCFNWLLH